MSEEIKIKIYPLEEETTDIVRKEIKLDKHARQRRIWHPLCMMKRRSIYDLEFNS